LASTLKENLAKTIDEAEWAWLKPHLDRDALIWVGAPLELLQVAVEIAENQTFKIQSYLSQGTLSKPTAAQIQIWNESPDKKFNVLIVQPFVLIQEGAASGN
jgi:hypothetical protein